jgi:hypothetical protein
MTISDDFAATREHRWYSGRIKRNSRSQPAHDSRRKPGESFTLDLSGLDLRSSDIRGARFQGAVLNGACFDNAQLNEADLQGAQMFGTSFRDMNLIEANLDFARSNFGSDVDEDGADFIGALYSAGTVWPRRETAISAERAAELGMTYPPRYVPRGTVYLEPRKGGGWAPRPAP